MKSWNLTGYVKSTEKPALSTSLRWYDPDQVRRVKELWAFFSQSKHY